MTSLLIFIVILGLLIVIHEWGHFIVARMFGIGVQRFSIGFGPVLLRKQVSGTEYCVSLVPLGGYVKLAGENAHETKGDPTEFATRPNYQKFLVVLAGPLMNAVLAFIIFSGVYMVGQPSFQPIVGQAVEGYPAHAAGIKSGDRILSINGLKVEVWQDILAILDGNRGEDVLIEVLTDNFVRTLSMTPKVEASAQSLEKKKSVGRIGIRPSGEITKKKSPFFQAVYLGGKQVIVTSTLIVKSLFYIVSGRISFRDSMTGPIGIYFLVDDFAQSGVVSLLLLTGLISVSLFVFNLLPIPVLDGGHLLFTLIESVIRRPIGDSVKERLSQAGFLFFIGLFVFIMYQDTMKFQLVQKVMAFLGHLL